ncbi:probable serine/threonine-protein kinase At1g54610 [Salvia miltiorrhiza]|uniref:probable serine/threonine-protein kinase At1g54610 n=1 Tax=Salvia miltiorrhiza TaxID=226208 RepID=UPI0025AD0C42|nr:probable serine/threonine-protein kinase At1g54610 [Salvia miltiorrhiza]
MGSSQSSKTYVKSPPMEMEKLRLVNGSMKEGPVRPARNPSSRERGGAHPGHEARRSASNSGSRDGDRGGEVSRRSGDGLMNKGGGEDDELVGGWPKWLVDNIPSHVLKNIVPKSADSYTKIDKVGQGTYSNVYKARDKDSGKLVALKKVRFDTSEPESVKFMAREIMILQKLDHPNILKLEGLATSRMQYSLYLVFDYMYSDLSRMLSRPEERLTEPQIKCYMQQLLSGLQHCHERGVLHRDIKGSNLLIDRNGMLKIGDFGLSNLFNPERKRPLTSRVVTLWYRAPELLLGSTDYGVGIDLWSAGCLMAEMYAGRPIMPARTEVEQLHRIFKLCGSPREDYYRRFKLSTALKPTQIYRPNLREAFKSFPSAAVDLLATLLSLDPTRRGTAASALQDKFFETNPLACDVSGLPAVHVEEDEYSAATERRKHRSSKMRRRSQSHREHRKKSSAAEKPSAANEGSKETSTDSSIFGLDPGSSSTGTSSKSVRPPEKEEEEELPRLFPSPVAPEDPPRVAAKSRVTDYYIVGDDGLKRLDSVQRSASSRAFQSLENKHIHKLHSLDV